MEGELQGVAHLFAGIALAKDTDAIKNAESAARCIEARMGDRNISIVLEENG